MPQKPFITILIPSWNSELFIERGVQSILKNSYDNIEVLIMDNNSTDRASKIISELKDDRVVFSAQKDKSMYEALNRGIKEAKGEIICWIGSDDRYDKDALKIIADTFKENPSINWLVGEGKFVFENENNRTIYHQLPQEITPGIIINGNPLISPSVAFRKNFFEKANCFDENYKYAADYDLWIKFVLMQNPFIIRSSLSLFSLNGDNISSKNKIDIYKETIRILNSIKTEKYFTSIFLNKIRMNLFIYYNYICSMIK
ncbi:MAG: glycosyltransferase [bacterium]|nr:glycosyltransferase [bacterium]